MEDHPAVSGDLLLDFSRYQKSGFYDQTHQNLKNQKPLMYYLEQAYDHAGCCSSCLGWQLKLVALFYDRLVDVPVRWALEGEELADDEEEASVDSLSLSIQLHPTLLLSL